MRKILIDTRELEHPKPLEIAIDELRKIDNDSYLYMLNRKNPIPLLSLASQHKFRVLSHEVSTDQWHILICKNPSFNLEELLDV